ncbi:MAG: carboxypeptidase-like regulatory domain-containing protein [Bacteroidota bacterium]
MKLSVFCIIIFLASGFIYPQNPDSLIIRGKVIKSETNIPIQFANIYITNSYTGTISDSLGTFILSFHKDNLNDSLEISCIGYTKFSYPLNSLNLNNELIIELDDSLFMLSEAKALAYDFFVGLFWNIGNAGEKRYLLTTATKDIINISNFIKILKSELGTPKQNNNILKWKNIEIKELKESKLDITMTYIRCKYCPGDKDINIILGIRNHKGDNLLLIKKKEDIFTKYFQELINQTFAQGIDYDFLEEKDGLKYLTNDNNPYSGKCFGYYKSGEKGLKGELKNGLKDGKWTYWYTNGQKKLEVNYIDGMKNGMWYYWYKNGQMRIQANYSTDQMIGLNKWWYENGQLKKQALYRNGTFISKIEYDENGNIIEKVGEIE